MGSKRKPAYIVEAEALLGEKEIKGAQHNKTILKLYEDSGHPEVERDEVAWCAAFVGATLHRAGYKRSGSLVARSYASFGKVLPGPELYCIGVMAKRSSSWKGHVGYVVGFDDKHIWMLGGNQNNQVSVRKYPRSGRTYEFIAFVRPEKRLSRGELAKKSRKLKGTKAAEGVTTITTVGGILSFQFLEQVRSFMTDNTGYILLGVAALVFVGLWLYKKFVYEDYEHDRYVPSGDADESGDGIDTGEAGYSDLVNDAEDFDDDVVAEPV